MSSNDWVQAGTPRDDDAPTAEWSDEVDDYGVPVETPEWDDYSDEQAVAAPTPPRPRVVDADPTVPTAPDPDDVVAGREQPVAAAEPDEPVEPFAHDPVAPRPDQEPPVAEAADDADAAAVAGGDEPVVAEVGEEPGVDTPVAEDADAAPTEESAGVTDEPLAADLEPEEHPTTVRPRDLDVDPFARPAPVGDGVGAAAGAAATGATAVGAAGMAGLYRDNQADETQVIEAPSAQRLSLEDEAEAERRQAEQLRAEKEARDQRLGNVATSDANAVRHVPRPRPGVGPFGSFGLFVLRIVTAGILGIIGYRILTNIDGAAAFLGQTLIPEPRLVSWILGFGLAIMAVLLVIGLGVRVVGFLLAAVAGCALAFIRWGQFSVFVPGMDGFLGDRDLLLAAVGIVFLSIGGGRFGLDGAISAARHNSREARRA